MRTKKKVVTKIISYLFGITILGAIIFYHKEISHFIVKKFIYHDYAIENINPNAYSLKRNFQLVQITDDFIAKDKKQLLNIFYTILDSGETEFYFYCDENYKECKDDVDSLIPNRDDIDSILSDINNFVHPYNSYKSINVTSNNFGKISVSIQKQYSNDKISEINQYLEDIKKVTIKDNMSEKEKIKAFHDYIVNYTSYDFERANNMNAAEFENSITHTAYGLLETKKSLCGGYSDIMSIFLNQLGIANIRISADNHVWNLVSLEDKWYHLDVTWDDPVTNTGEQLLIYDYFLIPYNVLLTTDPIEHKFNADIYIEAK